jgi:type IV pilus assembly protein PilY1
LPLIGCASILLVLTVRQRLSRAVIGSQTAPGCYGNLNQTTYTSGFSSTDFSYNSAVTINSGTTPPNSGVQLNTANTPLDPQHIILPFDQDVKIHYVYRNAGASHSLGWFYLDQLQPFLNKVATDATATLVDCDNDGIADWFQTASSTRAKGPGCTTGGNIDGLWHISSGQSSPDLIRSDTDYKDTLSVIYPHLPSILERLMNPTNHGGGMIFALCDDDTDTSVTTSPANGDRLTPVDDCCTAQDSYPPGNGIPDYDVNNNGTTDEVADRTVDLGTIQGNREIVFVATTYLGASLKNKGLGLSGSSSQTTYVEPWFTKNMLNPDYGGQTPGTVYRKTAIGCSRDDSTCYNAKGGDLGWMDDNTLKRLAAATNSADYHQLNIVGDSTVKTLSVGSDGSVPHFVVFAPDSNPNLWLLALDDQPEYVTSGRNSTSDADYNDVVFLIDRSNGGSVQSNLISSDIPSSQLGNSVISKIRIRFTASYPAPGCTGVSGATVNIYYSVDGKQTWHLVSFPSNTSGDTTIDVLGAGYTGNQLYWRADLISPVQSCQPVLNTLNIGYEAVQHGMYKFAAPIPLANMAYSGAIETPPFPSPEPAPTRGDYSLRGHFVAERLYDPTNTSATSLAQEWDAGTVLASTPPDSRTIYTAINGTLVSFATANGNNTYGGSTLYQWILPPSVRTAQSSGAYVYDFNNDGVANDTDAQFILQWTRGWEYPSGITFSPVQSALPRAWKLGPVHNSSPVVFGPSPRPVWMDGSAAPGGMASAHNAYAATSSTRATLAIVGAQDGMLHAFDAGQYRLGADPSCTVTLNRGCFAGASDAARYGTGSEKWAFIPPSQLGQLKNNHPQVRGYNPAANPPAQIDGSVSVEDVYRSSDGTFHTIAFASLGRSQPYVTAVDVTSPTAPAAWWSSDFTDVSFNGTELSPSVGLTAVGAGTFEVVLMSGLSSSATDLYLYRLNAVSGAQTAKVKLNTGSFTAQAYGFAGYPNLVDANQDGLVDRVYSVDTSGRIFKYDYASNSACVVATVGESVYSGMAVEVGGSGASPTVKLFLGSAPNPDGTGSCSVNSDCISGQLCSNMVCTSSGTAITWHLFAYQDNDINGTCTSIGAAKLYKVNLPAGQRLWAAPYVSNNTALFATAGTQSASVCLTAGGYLYQLSDQGDGSGNAPLGGVPASPQPLAGSAVSSLRVYDGHALVNTIATGTMIIGGPLWNNTPTGGNGSGGTQGITSLSTLLWQEY